MQHISSFAVAKQVLLLKKVPLLLKIYFLMCLYSVSHGSPTMCTTWPHVHLFNGDLLLELLNGSWMYMYVQVQYVFMHNSVYLGRHHLTCTRMFHIYVHMPSI